MIGVVMYFVIPYLSVFYVSATWSGPYKKVPNFFFYQQISTDIETDLFNISLCLSLLKFSIVS